MTFPPSAYWLLTWEPSQYLLLCLVSKLIQTSWSLSWCNPKNICERIMYHGSISNMTRFPLASDLRRGFIWVKVQRTSEKRIKNVFTHGQWTRGGSHGKLREEAESLLILYETAKIAANESNEVAECSWFRHRIIQALWWMWRRLDTAEIKSVGRFSLCNRSLCGWDNTAR